MKIQTLCLSRFFEGCVEDFVDASAVHIDDFEAGVVPLEGLTFFGDCAELVHDEAAERFEAGIFIGQFGEMELFFEVANGH